MTWGSVLLAEWQRWLAAWNTVPQNPLAHYFSLAQHRRLARIPAWRRWLPYFLVGALVLLGAAIPLAIETLNAGLYGVNPGEIVAVIIGIVFGIFSALFLVLMLTGIYETAISVMGFLGRPGLRVHSHVLDDMTSVTLLSDYEIVAAAVRIHWPRLAWISLLCGVLSWLWLLFFLGLDSVLYSGFDHEFIWAAVFGPLTVGTITLSGALAGLIYICWLLSAGNGLGNSLFASAAGVVVALAHLVTTPFATVFFIMLASELQSGYFSGPELVSSLMAPAMALVLVLAFALMLNLTEHWPVFRPFALILSPLMIPLGALLFVMLELWRIYGGITEQLTFEYTFVWRAFSMADAMVCLPPFCYGSFDISAMEVIPLEWYRYPLLIASQLALAALALIYARRAVRERRGNYL